MASMEVTFSFLLPGHLAVSCPVPLYLRRLTVSEYLITAGVFRFKVAVESVSGLSGNGDKNLEGATAVWLRQGNGKRMWVGEVLTASSS